MRSTVISHAAGAQAFNANAPVGSSCNSGKLHRIRNAVLLAGASALAIPSPAIANPSASANQANFTQAAAGAISTTVPDGVCAVSVSLTGGNGASSGTTAALGGRGAGGAIIGARFNVLAGQAVTGAAAGGGVNGSSTGTAAGGSGTAAGGNGGTISSATIHRGGGGGGSSSLSFGGVKVIEAGGGGGGGAAHQAVPFGNGGSGGVTFATVAGVGQVAAGNIGSAGSGTSQTVGAGQGGQTAAGGTGGVNAPNSARNGATGSATGAGGTGGPDNGTDSGGGGGGGFTGGGGGAATQGDAATGGGGGGGSSFVRAASPTLSAQVPTILSSSSAAATAGGATNGAAGSATIDWIPCEYDLVLDKTASVTDVNAGAKTIWTITVRNDGPDPMTKGDVITLTDTLPTGPIGAPVPQFKVLSIESSGGTNLDMASDPITCTGLSVNAAMPASTVCSRPYSAASAPGAPSGGTRGLNVGETLTITYEQVFANTATAASITNTATVVDRSTLIGTTNITGTTATRTSSATVNVKPYNLSVSKAASSAGINAGGTITWTVAVTNEGPGDMFGPDDTTANSLSVSDVAPTANAGAPSDFSSSGPAGACSFDAGTITCPGSLRNGEVQTFTFKQLVNASVPATTLISNTASVSDFFSGDSNDSAEASVSVLPSVNLSVVKSNGVTNVFAGSTITYTVVVTNNGPDSTTGAVVTDLPVAGITCPSTNSVAITGSGVPAGSFTIADLTGAGITLGTLNDGESATLTYACQVN